MRNSGFAWKEIKRFCKQHQWRDLHHLPWYSAAGDKDLYWKLQLMVSTSPRNTRQIFARPQASPLWLDFHLKTMENAHPWHYHSCPLVSAYGTRQNPKASKNTAEKMSKRSITRPKQEKASMRKNTLMNAQKNQGKLTRESDNPSTKPHPYDVIEPEPADDAE